MNRNLIVYFVAAVIVCLLSSCGKPETKPVVKETPKKIVAEKKAETPKEAETRTPTKPTNIFKDKRLWFVNINFDEKQQKDYHQLVSCNTELQDLVLHMDTEEFDKLAADQEDNQVLKGEDSRLSVVTGNLYGISPDKRYFFLVIKSSTNNPEDFKMKVLKVNNHPVSNVKKFKYIVYDVENHDIIFNKHSYYYLYKDIDKVMQTSAGFDYSPLYFKGDTLYLIEQKRVDEIFDIYGMQPDFLVSTNQYKIESNKFVKLSLKDSSLKYIDPLFDVLPWMTFNTQELGLVGMTDTKMVKKYTFPDLPTTPSDNYANVSKIFNTNNGSTFDVIELNKKLCGDKCEVFRSHFVGAYELKGKYFAIYYIELKEYYEDPVAYKFRSERLEDTMQLTHYYLVSLDTGDVKELPIDIKFQSIIFVRSNAVDNNKAFFYLRKEPLSDNEGKLKQKEQYVKAIIDGDKVELKPLQPNNEVKWFDVTMNGVFGINLSVFYQ